MKLDPNGQQLWLASYQGPAQGEHRGDAIVVDSAGNVYVAGTSPGNGTANDIFTVKYDANGTQLWVQRYNGSANGDDVATGLVVDSTGNVCACGSLSLLSLAPALNPISELVDGVSRRKDPLTAAGGGWAAGAELAHRARTPAAGF